MRRRALALVTAVVAASALALSVVPEAGAQGKKPPACAGKTKKKAVKAIKDAYAHFLDGAKYPDVAEKAPYIQYLSEPDLNEEFLAAFEASSAANAAAAATTGVQVNSVKCAGKKLADVDFDLVIQGNVAADLAPPGQAILEKGSKNWKVTALTLCNLQALGDPTILEREPCATITLEG